MKLWPRTALFIILALAGAAFATDAVGRWKLGEVQLQPRTEFVRSLTASITDTQHRTTFTLSADVVLSEVRDRIVYRNKLALLGIAGNTRAVVIFDLTSRHEIDWFYCSASKQILPGKIVSSTWTPNHAGGLTFDTVLVLYDLAKSPSENRSKMAPDLHFPLPVEADGELVKDVGIQIYPQSDVDEGSYFATPHEPGKPALGADLDTMVALTPQRLVFVASKGITGQDSVDWLEVVDLPHGASKAKSKRIAIPTERLHPDSQWVKLHQPFNPRWIPIDQIEVISSTHVRLRVPPEEYGVDSIDVEPLPDF